MVRDAATGELGSGARTQVSFALSNIYGIRDLGNIESGISKMVSSLLSSHSGVSTEYLRWGEYGVHWR